MRLMTVCAAFAAGVVFPLAAKPLDTAAVFASPTQEYGVNCWWWWLNGNTDKAAIAGDLAAMRDKGFQGAMVYDVGGWNDARTAQGCRGASRRGGAPRERRQRDRADRGDRRRAPVFDEKTFRGRINSVMSYLKDNWLRKDI